LTVPEPSSPTPDERGQYTLATTLSSDIDTLPFVRLTVSSAASISGTSANCKPDSLPPVQTVVCEAPRSDRAVPVTLVLTPAAPVMVSTPVTISVAPPPEYDESRPDDNARTVELQPAPASAPISYSEGPTAHALGKSNEHLLRATVSDIPDSATSVKFTLHRGNESASSRFTLILAPSIVGCRIDDNVATCDIEPGTEEVRLLAEVRLPSFPTNAFFLTAEAGGQVVDKSITESAPPS
jgi:hypothetical protein